MRTIKFHDYASTYNLQDFLYYCEDKGYKVKEITNYLCNEGYRVTEFATDEETANHLHCQFPHNVTMGDKIQKEQVQVVRTTNHELCTFIKCMNELKEKKLTNIACELVTKFVDFCSVWDLNVMGGAISDDCKSQYLYID